MPALPAGEKAGVSAQPRLTPASMHAPACTIAGHSTYLGPLPNGERRKNA